MRSRSGGYILVSALAVLSIFAALIAGAAALVRASVAEAELRRDQLSQDALSHAGLELAAYQLFMLRRPLVDLTEQRVRLDAGVVTLTVTGEGGKVDLNGADAALLAGLWRSLGLTAISPEAFAGRVIDWRDSDATQSPGGAERADYAAAGAPGPPDAPFQSVDDIRFVLGVGAEAARALTPYLTVANPRGEVSATAAARAVLRALPKTDASSIEQIVALRRKGPAGREDLRKLLANKGIKAKLDPGPVFGIRVHAAGPLEGGVTIVSVLGSAERSRLYRVIEATRGERAAATEPR